MTLKQMSLMASLMVVLLAIHAEPSSSAAPLTIQTLADQHVTEGLTPGIVIGVGRADGTVEFYSAGTLEAGQDTLVDENTIFEIGSISKVFTTLMLAQMESDNLLCTQDSVQAFLPAEVRVPLKNKRPITLGELATHTSGLPRMPDNMKKANPANPYADYTFVEMYEFLSDHEISSDVGDEGVYSNLGMGLLGHALEQRAGTDYETLVTTRICEPLGMGSTSTKPGENVTLRVATGHVGLKPTSQWDIPTMAGAGDINSSTRDMLVFAMANVDTLESDLHDDMALCHEARVPVAGSPHQYGLGWMIETTPGSSVYFHNGGTGGFRSSLGFRPKTSECVVILANSDKADTNSIMAKVLYSTEPHPGDASSASDPGNQYIGTYETPPFATYLNITKRGDRLMLQVRQEKPMMLIRDKRDEFHTGPNNYRLFFLRKGGQVNRVDVRHDGKTTQYSKRSTPYPPEAIKLPVATLNRYAGNYKLLNGKAIFAITRRGNKLRAKLELAKQIPNNFDACSQSRFFSANVIAEISFLSDDFDRVYALVLHQNGRNSIYMRQP